MKTILDLQTTEEAANKSGGAEDEKIVRSLTPVIIVGREDLAEEYGEEIELPEVRLEDQTGGNGRSRNSQKPVEVDVARAWKAANEWIQELVVYRDERVRKKIHENRVKDETNHYRGVKTEEKFRWQYDEETMKDLRPIYRPVKEKLIEDLGNPKRSAFASLFPHEFDDLGLSGRARRAVRDLKAVFGEDILLKS